MLRTALCGDTLEKLEHIAQYLKEYKANTGGEIICDCFSNGDRIAVSGKNNILISDLFLKYQLKEEGI